MASNLIEIGTDPSSPISDAPGSEDVAQAGLAAAHDALDEAADSPKAKLTAAATTLGFSAGDSDTEAQEDADDAVDKITKAASDVKSAMEDKAVAKQQHQDVVSPKAELSNEDVIASFLGANDSADSANDSSIAHHDAIVNGDSNDKDVDDGATTQKGTEDGPQSSGAEDEDDKPAEPASAKIKRLSSFFETTPSESGSGPIKSAVPVGKIKHSFGGGSEAGSFQSGSSSSRMSLTGVDKSQSLGVTVSNAMLVVQHTTYSTPHACSLACPTGPCTTCACVALL
jgi:hypothetical protein